MPSRVRGIKKITRESKREVRGGGEIRVDLYVVGIPEGSKGIDPHLLDNIDWYHDTVWLTDQPT